MESGRGRCGRLAAVAGVGVAVKMVLHNGHVIDLADIRPMDFDPERTAAALASVRRFAGNYGDYSVAQHAVLVARTVCRMGKPYELDALHHDDDESITSDVPKPVKRMVGDAWEEMVRPMKDAINKRYLVDVDRPAVKEAERIVFAGELRWVVPAVSRHKYPEAEDPGLLYQRHLQPVAAEFTPWGAERARLEYLALHEELTR